MKTLRTLLTLVISAITLTACAQKITFPSLEGQSDVSKIYVGKAMMRMAGASIGNVPGDIVKKLDAIEIITSEKATGSKKIQDAFTAYLNDNPGMDILVQVEDNKDKVNIYSVPGDNPDTYSKIIIYIIDGDDGDTVLMVMNGKLNSGDLAELAEMNTKGK